MNVTDWQITTFAKFKMCAIELNSTKANYKYKVTKQNCDAERKCICGEIIEDELHIMTQCANYKNIREKTMKSIQSVNTYEKLGILISKSTDENLRKIITLASSIVKQRTKIQIMNQPSDL